jgi:hypothetical protein
MACTKYLFAVNDSCNDDDRAVSVGVGVCWVSGCSERSTSSPPLTFIAELPHDKLCLRNHVSFLFGMHSCRRHEPACNVEQLELEPNVENMESSSVCLD